MRKIVNILLGLIVAAPITYFVGLIIYSNIVSVSEETLKSFETELPMKIVVTDKNKTFLKVEEFINTRQHVLSKSMDKFEIYCSELYKEKKIIHSSLYQYGNNINIELNRVTSTYNIFRDFINNNPYGVYINDDEQEQLEDKISKLEKEIDDTMEFLNRKYKNGFLINGKKYKFYQIKEIFISTYKAKHFLENDLRQSDIDKSILKFKNRALKNSILYNTVFAAIPELWDSVVKKNYYDKPLQNYYLKVFNMNDNKKFQSLRLSTRLIILDVLEQALSSHRVGYVDIFLKDIGINKFIGEEQLTTIDNMILVSMKKINSISIAPQKEQRKISNANYSGMFQSETKYHIQELINLFKQNKKEDIANLISYPLKREYPIKAIKNKNEFLHRYNEIFDKAIIAAISESNVDKDWSQVGSNGIMFNNGDVWLNANGKIIAVNYQSNVEQIRKENMLNIQKDKLHQTVSQFKEAILEWRTKKFLIRVDDIGDGNYRYTAWSKHKDISDKPDIVLTDGKRIWEGSGGNHFFIFKSGQYEYKCNVTVLGKSESESGYLEVFKNGKLMLTDEAIKIESIK